MSLNFVGQRQMAIFILKKGSTFNDMWQLLIAGFTIGCTSSFHCIGMCGPLSLALPVRNMPKAKREVALILYNAGRVVTYSLLGFFFGMLGRTIHIAGLQQVLSIVLGSILLVSA